MRTLFLIAPLLGWASAFAVVAPQAVAVRRSGAVCMAEALRTNDMVKVISGDAKVRNRSEEKRLRTLTLSSRSHALSCFFLGAPQGTIGKLLSVDKKKGKVVVEDVNIKTKHIKPMKEGESGSIVKKENPIHISNVVMTDEQPAPAEAAPPAAE